MKKPVLSVVIISYNQKAVLKRCIDSVLTQETSFPVEVIVSDDRSSDGTKEMLINEYKDKVITTFFNSDKYDVSYVLERAALNRINGLKSATGEYLIHIDGDDYFTGKDVFQKMVDTLESHPECNLCCQNYYKKPWNRLNDKIEPVKPMSLFEGEQILTGPEFIEKIGIGHNTSFCVRRIESVKVNELTSNTYDDLDITFRYMAGGSVALINRCNFVYVEYPSSSTSTLTLKEKHIMFNSNIFGVILNPSLAGVLLKKYIGTLARISLEVIRSSELPLRLVTYCKKFDMRLFDGLKERMSIRDRLGYLGIFLLASFIKVMPFNYVILKKIVYKKAFRDTIGDNVIL